MKIKEFLYDIKNQYNSDNPDMKKKRIDTFLYKIEVFSNHIKVNLYCCDKALNLDFCSRMERRGKMVSQYTHSSLMRNTIYKHILNEKLRHPRIHLLKKN